MGGEGEEALGFAAEGESGGGEDGAEGGVSGEDAGAEFGWERAQENFDQAVFHDDAGGGGVEGDFAEVDRIVQLGMEDGERDGIAMERGELRGHVVIVDEELLVGLGDFSSRDPSQWRHPEVGGGEQDGEFGGQGGDWHLGLNSDGKGGAILTAGRENAERSGRTKLLALKMNCR